MTARHAAAVGASLERRIADQFVRHANDLRFPRLSDAALAAAVRILAEPDLAAGLRALATVDELDRAHQPRAWAASVTGYVCTCGRGAHPCDVREVIDRALPQTSAAGGCGGSTPPAAGPQLPTDEMPLVLTGSDAR